MERIQSILMDLISSPDSRFSISFVEIYIFNLFLTKPVTVPGSKCHVAMSSIPPLSDHWSPSSSCYPQLDPVDPVDSQTEKASPRWILGYADSMTKPFLFTLARITCLPSSYVKTQEIDAAERFPTLPTEGWYSQWGAQLKKPARAVVSDSLFLQGLPLQQT